MTSLQPDTRLMLRCARALFPGAKEFVFAAIDPNGQQGRNVACRRVPANDDAMVEADMKRRNLEGKNIYFLTGSPIKEWTGPNPPTKPPNANEIACSSLLHVDVDPDTGELPAECRARVLAEIEANVAAGKCRAPTLRYSSGNGIQIFWRLAATVSGELAEEYNQRLIKLFKTADKGAWNSNRVMRLAGGINWPNKTKADRGCVPVLSGEHYDHHPERVYGIGEFGDATPECSKEATPVAAPSPGKRTDRPRPTDIQVGWCTDADALQIPIAANIILNHAGDPVEMHRRLEEASCRMINPDGSFKPYDGRSEWGQAAIIMCADAGLSEQKIFGLVLDPLWKAAFGHFQDLDGAKQDRAIFRSISKGEKLRAEREAEALKKAVRESPAGIPVMATLNKRWAVVNMAGKMKIMTTRADPEFPLQRVTEFWGKEDFVDFHVEPMVTMTVGDPPRDVPVGRGKYFLLRTRERLQHDGGVCFLPGKDGVCKTEDPETGETYTAANMFRGWAVLPDPKGSCQLYLDHIHDNICAGDEDVFEYVLDWMASGIQHPEDPERSSPVLQGEPGCGKGTLAIHYGRLFGRHFMHVQRREHVTGKFNGHFGDNLLTFVDEAFHANSKDDERVLKTMITEKSRMIERKGIDAIKAPNFSRYIFAGNDEFIMRVGGHDRRYCVLKCKNTWAKDCGKTQAERREYFRAINKQMADGGYEALMDLLLKRDVSKYDSEDIPETAARREHQLNAADEGDKVIIAFAQEGRLPGSSDGHPHAARAKILLNGMRAAGAWREKQGDYILTQILERWKFERDPRRRNGSLWAAPPLADLRKAITEKYPTVNWSDQTEWLPDDSQPAVPRQTRGGDYELLWEQ